MSKKISQSQIDLLRKKYFSDNHVKVVRNAMVKTNSNELSMDWEKYRKIDHTFSNVISGEMPATNQKSSGRCWGFAGLNLLRIYDRLLLYFLCLNPINKLSLKKVLTILLKKACLYFQKMSIQHYQFL